LPGCIVLYDYTQG